MAANGRLHRTHPGRASEAGPGSARQGASTRFDHLEVVLADAAIRTGPGVRNVFPAGAGVNALFGQTERLVVNEAAHHAHELAVGDGGFGCSAHGPGDGDDSVPY